MPLLPLVALLAAAPAPVPEAVPLEVLEAGEVQYDVALDRGLASGGVVLRRGLVLMRAASASYDAKTGEVEAWGGVLLLEPGRATSASRMHAVLDGPYQAHDVVAFLKEGSLDLSKCRTLDEARRTGRNKLTLGGAEVSGESGERPPHLEVERARITLCDCGAEAPSWEIRAARADIRPGDRAILSWPVFYLTPRFLFMKSPVPVFALPALYLPLAERQTGLLLPDLSLGGNAGFGIAQPVFVTLGRSWDATVTPGYAFGPGRSVEEGVGRALQGPSLGLELRWAPAEGTAGVARLALLHSVVALWPAAFGRPAGLNRVALTAVHGQRLSEQDQLRVDVGLVNDPFYTFDFAADPLLRAADYRRSAVTYTHRADDLLLEADAAYHLPIQYLFLGSTVAGRRAPFGVFGADLSTFHRLPSASVTLLPVPVAGPVTFSGFAGVARFAPLRGATGDEGADGIGPGERGWGNPAPSFDPGEGDGRWESGERLAATRAAARAELRAPFSAGGALEVEPWLAATGTAYAFENGDRQADARAVLGMDLWTRLERTFGGGAPATRYRHTLEPRLGWRAGTGQAGPPLPAFAYDELDAAPAHAAGSASAVPTRPLTAMAGRFQQLQLSLRNRLVAPPGGLVGAELNLGQDLDLDAGALAETWAQGWLQIWRARLDLTTRFYALGARAPVKPPDGARPSFFDSFSELSAGLTFSDGRGDDVHASVAAVGWGASPRLVAGLEPFFDRRELSFPAMASGSVGTRARVSGATLAYDALFNARDMAPRCAGKSATPHVYAHTATFVWDSPCKCWKAGFVLGIDECQARPSWSFIIDLSALGGGKLGVGG